VKKKRRKDVSGKARGKGETKKRRHSDGDVVHNMFLCVYFGAVTVPLAIGYIFLSLHSLGLILYGRIG
jgi:hypothetical protein